MRLKRFCEYIAEIFAANDNRGNVVDMRRPSEDAKFDLKNHEGRIIDHYVNRFGPGTDVHVDNEYANVTKPDDLVRRETEAAQAKVNRIGFTPDHHREMMDLYKRLDPRLGFTIQGPQGHMVTHPGYGEGYEVAHGRMREQLQNAGLTPSQAKAAAIAMSRTDNHPMNPERTVDQMFQHRSHDLMPAADYPSVKHFFKKSKLVSVGSGSPGEVSRLHRLLTHHEDHRQAEAELTQAERAEHPRWSDDVNSDYREKHGRDIYDEPLTPMATHRPREAMSAQIGRKRLY